ncbi:uncharacterized protein LOC131878172 [Tigriopus californicus]|uniref:uncharacterized protein LOC131878172 n=1 Tax=Tigriopus californicus TaxID=6832 RepID=UPI0027DA076B|nr:uncharacterized protein LOC131878172 [Tigriopus californicus]
MPKESASHKKRKNGTYCCVVDCRKSQRVDGSRGIKYHSFPTDEKRYYQWVRAVRRENAHGSLWSPSYVSRICSSHFVGGVKSDDPESPAYYATIFPTKHVKPKTMSDLKRFERRRSRENAKLIAESAQTSEKAPQIADEDRSLSLDSNRTQYNHVFPDTVVGLSSCVDVSTQTEESNAPCEFRWSCDAEINGNVMSFFTMASIPPEICPKNPNIDRGNPDPNESKPALFPILSLSEKQFQTFCGISISDFQYLLYKGGDDLKDTRVLSREQKLALFFVKLKLNCSFLVLGGMFNVSQQFASSTFRQVLEVMSIIMNTFLAQTQDCKEFLEYWWYESTYYL